MKSLLMFMLLVGATSASADVAQDFQGLGGNKVLLDRVQEFNPGQEVSIVQDRIVNRRNRIEISPEFLGSFGGDTYTRTQAFGLNLQYHITPRWSLGVRHAFAVNQLTPEGKKKMDEAERDYAADPSNPTAKLPTLDYPTGESFATLYWYPVYGKMSLLNQGIAHFDFYTLAGYGQVTLKSGTVPSYTAGGGFGFWWTQHFSSRVEMRYQNYTAKYLDTKTKLDLAIASVQVGWLL